MAFNNYTQEEADQERNTSWTTPRRDVTHSRMCPRCGAGPLGNCGAYGAEISRERCPEKNAVRNSQQKATDQ